MKPHSFSPSKSWWRIIGITTVIVALLLPLVQPQTSLAQAKPGSKSAGKQATPATCIVSFLDVQTTDFFYDGVRYLFCQGAIGGYADNTFRPTASTTRAQMSKILVLTMGWPLLNPSAPSFNDVPSTSPFYEYIETAKAHGAISGYADGNFKPENPVIRGQLSKMVTMAQGWSLDNPPTPTFNDVAPGSPFYTYVETAASHGAIAGYADGSFRPGVVTNRGQVAKVVYYADTSLLTPQEQQTIDLINQRRAGLGLVTLQENAALSRAARRHSYDIGPLGLCQHTGTDGSSPWDRAAEAGYTGFAMGEVVGCNYQTPQEVVDAWWASPAHHDVLVDPNARDLGCGWWLNSSGYGWQTCMTGTHNP